jgi:hypothetical protein
MILGLFGRGLSVRAIADWRESIIALLKVGPDLLAVHCGMMPARKTENIDYGRPCRS